MPDPQEALIRAVGSILQRGAYDLAVVEALRAAAADKADIGARRLADHTLAWLMQSSKSEAIYYSGVDSMN